MNIDAIDAMCDNGRMQKSSPSLEQLNARPPFFANQIIRYTVGRVGNNMVTHLLVSYQAGKAGTFRPDCNGQVDYRRVGTLSALDTDRVTCQKCLKSLGNF